MVHDSEVKDEGRVANQTLNTTTTTTGGLTGRSRERDKEGMQTVAVARLGITMRGS